MSGAIQCDACGKFAAVTTWRTAGRAAWNPNLPAGWFSVGIADHEARDDQGDWGQFCCRNCAATFVRRYKTEEAA